MKRYPLFFVLILVSTLGKGQVFIEMNPKGQDYKGDWTVYGTENLNKSIPDEKVNGSRYWSEDWKLASLYGSNKNVIARLFVRYNLLSQEVHFKDLEGKEQVASPEILKMAVLHPGEDTSGILTVFRNDLPDVYINNKPVQGYLEELNRDTFRLMKLNRRELVVMDARFGTEKRYELRDRLDYFISGNNRVVHLKKLSAEYVLTALPRSSGLRPYIKEQGLSLKKENDVLVLLKAYDEFIKKQPLAGKAD
ncbi:hypothetical protein ACFSQD_18410 [Flavihumibacter stibioxidans]|uniref:Uncharacterized protein n=1 Tax=Flavihumibacter stibioxidans TaxID=1834163 RepID=A0ABR7MCR1_9BACT|nr:hypothetical protein [Flavihumibacter stibioxidans]MBC6492614.1 hypothetical protein [Flavihumibacter stibioxidans]